MERKVASDYPQELLDLFHEYQHGDISRRTFLDRAAKFAVGSFTAAAMLESLRPNFAWAQQVPKDDSRLKSEYLEYPSPQGNPGKTRGYLVRPASASGTFTTTRTGSIFATRKSTVRSPGETKSPVLAERRVTTPSNGALIFV